MRPNIGSPLLTMTLNPTIKFSLFVLFMLVLGTTSVVAQQYEQDYEDEEDYDYSQNNYNNNYYEKYSEQEYKRRNERFYKRSYREEDLYNGGYRSRTYNENQTSTPGGGWGLFSFGKKNNGTNDESPSAPSNPRFNRYDGIENGVGQGPNSGKAEGFNEPTQHFEPGKGQVTPGGDGDSKTVPPPPDEPDVPVDTAIPLLIAFAIGIVSFRTILHKKASA